MVLQRKYLFKVSYFQINASFRYFSLNALSSQLQLAMTNWCWLDRRKFCLILLCSLWPNTSRVNVCRWYSENSLLYNQLSYALHYLHVSVLSWWNLKMYILYKGQMDLRCSTISNIYVGHHCESIWLTWTNLFWNLFWEIFCKISCNISICMASYWNDWPFPAKYIFKKMVLQLYVQYIDCIVVNSQY